MTDDSHQPDTPLHVELDDATAATLGTLEAVLDAVRARHPDTPQWEFCEGLMTALLCTRRPIGDDEWLPVLFGRDGAQVFASPAESTRFFMGWMERKAQLSAELRAPIDSLDDERALSPAVLDWRGLMVSLTEAERAEIDKAQSAPPPALGQVWAAGFMTAVDIWADDWAYPRDKEIAENMRDALDCVADLLDDDTGPPALNLYSPDAPPSVSQARFEAFGEALWAVYDLYDIATALGPRIAPVRKDDKVGRNDPCPCGSGKKYKKCCAG